MSPLCPPSHGAPDPAPIPARAGIGLRAPHHDAVLTGQASADWFEVHPENYMTGARLAEDLETIRADHPLSLHAVGLSLGSADGLDEAHLRRLSDMIARYQPALVSDHLSWSAFGGLHLPDLLPLPYTEEALAVTSRNLNHAQARLKRRLLVENLSTYLTFADSGMAEGEFFARLVEATGCGLLLDVNNLYVSACNLGRDPQAAMSEFLGAVPAAMIGEIHLAGHAVRPIHGGGRLRIDDHGSPVCPEVWRLYRSTIAMIGPRPTLIEWDTHIPAFGTLTEQARQAQEVLDAGGREVAHHALAG